jgi:hypothetical protein
VQTPLRASHDSGVACTLRLSADDAPDGLAFVLLDAGTGAMLGCPETGSVLPLCVALPATAPGARLTTASPQRRVCGAAGRADVDRPAAAAGLAAAELTRSEQLTAAQRAARAGNPFTRLALADVQRQLSLADAVAVCRGIDTLLKQSQVQRRPSRARAARRTDEQSAQQGADSAPLGSAQPGRLHGGDAR